LNVTEGVTEVNGQLVVGAPKSHQAHWLPVPAFLLDELRAEIRDRGPDDLVFPSPQGAILRVGNFRRGYFDRAAREAGLAGLVPHELRHTAASLAIAAGATVKSVQRMLGHASATLYRNGCAAVRRRWGGARKCRLTCGFARCPRQDSNLRRTV